MCASISSEMIVCIVNQTGVLAKRLETFKICKIIFALKEGLYLKVAIARKVLRFKLCLSRVRSYSILP